MLHILCRAERLDVDHGKQHLVEETGWHLFPQAWSMAIRPDDDDVVVREKRGNPSALYILGTPSTPAQFQVRTRDEAVSQALAFARRQHVRAWFAKDEAFMLLGTFRNENNSQGHRHGEKGKDG
jgi:hypothetical protein